MEFSEKRLIELLQFQFAFFIVCDEEGLIQYINPEGEDFFRLKKGESAGKDLLEIIPENYSGPLWKIALEALKSERPFNHDVLLPSSVGDAWRDVTATPVHDEISGRNMVILTGRHPTESRNVLKEYERSEIKPDILLDGFPVPMFILDNNHRVIYWNKALESQSGIKSGDAIGTKSQWKIFYPEERPTLADLLLDDIPENLSKWYAQTPSKSEKIPGAYEVDNYYPNLGPEGKWFRLIAYVMRNEDGRIVGATETYIDISGQKKAEADLIASRNRYQGYIEDSPNALLIVDREGNYVEVNPAACDMLGYNEEEFLHMNILDVVPPEDIGKVIKQFEGYMTTGHFNTEVRLMTKDGEILNVILKAAALPNGTYLGFTTDITELKKTSQELIDRERIFRLLFETMTEGVAIHDLVYKNGEPVDYILTDANGAFEEILGIPRTDAVGSLATKLYGTDIPPYFDIYTRVAVSGSPENFETYYPPMKKNFAISVASPKKGSFATIFTDITEKTKYDTAIRESEEKFHEVFNNANDILMLVGINGGSFGNILEVNRVGYLSLGYEEDELLKMDPFLLVEESEREEVIEMARDIYEITENPFEVNLSTKDGRIVPVEVKSKIFKIGGKDVALAIMRDISERKTAREIEKKAFSQIEDNIQQLATLGDSIRNPLAVIVGIADLHGEDIGDRIKKEAEEIDDYITMLDRGWIESEKVRNFLKRHYDLK